jgi:hypothetical protein
MTQTQQTLQSFLARATAKAAEDLIAAVERVPDDKRAWSPMGDARTVLDVAAECAILNGSTVNMLQTRAWPAEYDFAEYEREKAELASKGWPAVKALLNENTPRAIAAIKELKDEDLDVEVPMPWGNFTVAQIASYPYWNMCYHEGQANYVAAMLGKLE